MFVNQKGSDFSTVPRFRSSFAALIFFVFLTVLAFPIGKWFSSDMVKIIFFALGVGVVFVIVFFEQLRSGSFYFHRTILLKILSLGVLLSSVSALFSPKPLDSFGSFSFALGTVLCSVFLLIFLYSALNIFSKANWVVYFYILTAVSLVFLITLQSVDFFLFSFVGIPQETLVGQTLNLPIVLGFAVLFFVSILDLFPLGFLRRLLLYMALVISFVLMLVIPFPTVWQLLSLFLFLFLCFFLSVFHSSQSGPLVRVESRTTPLPWHTIVFFVISFSFIFVSPNLSVFFDNIRGERGFVAEIRPSFRSSIALLERVYEGSPKNMWLGVGTSSFSSVWSLYRPEQINSTPAWNVDFEVAYSSLMTIAVTGGILGVSVWVLFYGFFVIEGVRFFFAANFLRRSAYNYYLAGISFLLGGYVFVWQFFYLPNVLLLMLGVVVSAAGVALSSPGGYVRFTVNNFFGISPFMVRRIIGMIVMLIFFALFSFVALKILSAFYYQKAKNTLLLSHDVKGAIFFIEKALKFGSSDLYYRTSSEIKQSQINEMIEGGNLDTKKIEAIRLISVQADEAAKEAVARGAGYYLNWVVQGNSQFQNFLLFDQGYFALAETSYSKAISLAPSNPIPYYLKARLLVEVNRKKEAESLLQKSLLLKANYLPSASLLNQISIH